MKHTRYPFPRAGFTLAELVVVMAVIATLAAIGVPIYHVIIKQGKIAASRNLVMLVAQQIENYGVKRWTWSDPTKKNNSGNTMLLSGNMFALKQTGQSLNGRGERIPFPTIDGRPPPANPSDRAKGAEYDGPFINQSSLINSGYTGFFDMVGAPIDQQRYVNAKHQIIDAWGEPLRIVYAANVYGTRGFGIWSPGPDRVDQDMATTNPRDDLRSWEGVDDPPSKGKQ